MEQGVPVIVIMKHVVGPTVIVTGQHMDAHLIRGQMAFVTQPVSMKQVDGTMAIVANTNTVS